MHQNCADRDYLSLNIAQQVCCYSVARAWLCSSGDFGQTSNNYHNRITKSFKKKKLCQPRRYVTNLIHRKIVEIRLLLMLSFFTVLQIQTCSCPLKTAARIMQDLNVMLICNFVQFSISISRSNFENVFDKIVLLMFLLF
jgi:hypothetical protein